MSTVWQCISRGRGDSSPPEGKILPPPEPNRGGGILSPPEPNWTQLASTSPPVDAPGQNNTRATCALHNTLQRRNNYSIYSAYTANDNEIWKKSAVSTTVYYIATATVQKPPGYARGFRHSWPVSPLLFIAAWTTCSVAGKSLSRRPIGLYLWYVIVSYNLIGLATFSFSVGCNCSQYGTDVNVGLSSINLLYLTNKYRIKRVLWQWWFLQHYAQSKNKQFIQLLSQHWQDSGTLCNLTNMSFSFMQ